MTKDEIEKLAVEAGWPLFAIQMLAGTEDEKRLQRFAELVAKAEREACAVLCDDIEVDRWSLFKGRSPYSGQEEGRASNYVQGESDGAGKCADVIRARGNA